MRAPNIFGCSVQTHLTTNVEPGFVDRETKEKLGACFEQFQCSPSNIQQRPTSPNNAKQGVQAR